MGELILWLLIVAGLAVAWIEWIPQRYAIFPQFLVALSLIPAGLLWLPYWYGWATSLFGAAILVWIYFSPKRRKDWPNLFMLPVVAARRSFVYLKAIVVWSVIKFRGWKSVQRTVSEEPHLSDKAAARASDMSKGMGEKIRVWFGTVALFVLSPLTAIPWTLLMVLVLIAGDALFGSLPAFVDGTADIAKYILGRTFVSVIAAIDVMARHAFLSVPVFLAVAYVISRWAARAEPFWRRFFVGLFYYGALYPLVLILADIFDAFDGPLYN